MSVLLSDKAVLLSDRENFVWQLKPLLSTKKYRLVLLLQRGGSTTWNGKDLSGNMDHQIPLPCTLVFSLNRPLGRLSL